ncbi:bis(5'-nucleosyl)-tetraphosphatase (symmetrical) YqeK [Eggerthellaceae bacterium 3-80]|nr:HD domain-containing protein [bacterium D16-34]
MSKQSLPVVLPANEQDYYTFDDRDPLTSAFYDARQNDLKARLKPKRYEHSVRVAQTAGKLAKLYGVDEDTARLAGLLHDWDKDFNDADAQKRARVLGVDLHPAVIETMPRLLHGPTAAAALGRIYPQLPPEVLQAIARHTTGAVGMSDLDMIVYIADALEPGRDFAGLDQLRDVEGELELEELFLQTFRHILISLIDGKRRFHPQTATIWNYYVERNRARSSMKG